MSTAIWWVRRDLRLTDNQALSTALRQTDQVVPVFILDPTLLSSRYVGEKRLAFLLAGLRRLDADLQACGSRLIVRHGDPHPILADLLAETGAEAIIAEADGSPYARQRDHAIAQTFPLDLTGGLTVHPPGAVLKEDGDPYIVYSPFSRSWKARSLPKASDLLPAPGKINTPDGLSGEAIPAEPELPEAVPFPAGEAEAQRRLAAFTGRFHSDDGPDLAEQSIYQYGRDRNRMDLEGTSRLSPYLRFGMLSARQAVVAALQAMETASDARAQKGAETWLNELIWREFYLSILYHFPHVRGRSFRPKYDRVPWDNDETTFAAWCEGRTGYPVVDAAMRQLVQSGWMHNRARMIVASFLVKDLLIDWRWGERFFMQHLVDGDLAANNGGWQWTAGTGTDAAPYFRIFNPVLQGQKFDPDGAYIRRWIPELAGVSDKHIHTPWRMSHREQKQAGCLIDRNYPAPIVDHGEARERTLAAYDQVKLDE